jgi:hypothetical protein
MSNNVFVQYQKVEVITGDGYPTNSFYECVAWDSYGECSLGSWSTLDAMKEAVNPKNILKVLRTGSDVMESIYLSAKASTYMTFNSNYLEFEDKDFKAVEEDNG